MVLFTSLTTDHLNAGNCILFYVFDIPMLGYHHTMSGNYQSQRSEINRFISHFKICFSTCNTINGSPLNKKIYIFVFKCTNQVNCTLKYISLFHRIDVSSFEGLHLKAADMAISIYMCFIYFRVSTKL